MDFNKTPLYSTHVALNAKMAAFAGWSMPLQYSSAKEEVISTRKSCSVFDVSHMGEFLITGTEAVAFVDNIITNDFLKASVGKAVYSPVCREDGTVIDDVIAYKISQEKVLVCVNAANIQKDWDWFVSHLPKFNCQMKNISAQTSLLALQGPRAAEFIKNILPEINIEQIPTYGLLHLESSNSPWLIARTGYTGEDGFEIFANNELAAPLWNQLLSLGVTPAGLIARDVLRLEACYPLYGHEINDELTPLDAGLGWTVKFNKTDFIGKKYLQAYIPKWKLIKFSQEQGIPREGQRLLNWQKQEIGKVCSGTFSFTLNKGVAMGHVLLDTNSEGNIFIEQRGKIVNVNIHNQPFYKRGK